MSVNNKDNKIMDKIINIIFIKLFINYFYGNLDIFRLVEIIYNMNILGNFIPNKKLLALIFIILIKKKDVICMKYLMLNLIIKKISEKNSIYLETLLKSKYCKTHQIKFNINNFAIKCEQIAKYINSFRLKLTKKELFHLNNKVYKLESDFLLDSDSKISERNTFCDSEILKTNLKYELIERYNLLIKNIGYKVIYLNYKDIQGYSQEELFYLEFKDLYKYYCELLDSIYEKLCLVRKESKAVNNLKTVCKIFINNKSDVIKNISDISKIARKLDVDII